MLIREHTPDGRTAVRLHKDWTPAAIGSNLQPKLRNYVDSDDARLLQRALLSKSHYDASSLRASNISSRS